MSAWLDERAQPHAPDGLLEKTIERTASTPPRPAWRIPAWWRDLPERLGPGATGRQRKMTFYSALAAALAALAITIGLVATDTFAPDVRPAAPTRILSVAADGSGDYATITAAVEAAVDGDTIRLQPGTYAGPLVVTKDLVIEGDGPRDEIIVTAERGLVLHLRDAVTRLAGFTVTGPDTMGVRVEGGSATIDHMHFDAVGHPFVDNPCRTPCFSLRLMEGAQAVVQDSLFTDGGQLRADSLAAVEIADNELWGGPHVAIFDVADGSQIRGNRIGGTHARGIGLFRPTTALIEGNTIEDGGTDGISIGWEGGPAGIDPVVRGNTIVGSESGIYVADGASPTLEGNTIEDVDHGLVLVGSSAPTLSGNSICGLSASIDLEDGAAMPATDGNDICGELVSSS